MSYLILQKSLKIIMILLVCGLTLIMLVLGHQGWIATVLAERNPKVVYFVETEELVVGLTIDDGPDPLTTPKILDILEQNGARATFFLITDHIPGNEELVDRIVREGHEIGNHLMTDEASIKLAPEEFERQLVEAHKILSNFTDVHWFRPGKGRYTGQMLSIVHKHSYQTVLGSIYPFDPAIPSSWFATQHIVGNVRPGSIIILHDVGARGERTATTLELVLSEFQRRGYRTVTLSELLTTSK